jgi:hypothetical protein
MSAFPHDTFAKDYLTELLNTIGKAKPNQVIKSERREGDIWFERDPGLSLKTQRDRLGLMGQLFTHGPVAGCSGISSSCFPCLCGWASWCGFTGGSA